MGAMMSSTFEPKWTPGPWQVEHHDTGWTRTGMLKAGEDHHFANVYSCEDPRGCRDCELIALAPELAAAVLAYVGGGGDDCGGDCGRCGGCMLQSCAERLRMIGADDAS